MEPVNGPPNEEVGLLPMNMWRIIYFSADIFSLDSQLNVKIPIKRNINSSDMSLTILKSTYHRKKQKTPFKIKYTPIGL